MKVRCLGNRATLDQVRHFGMDSRVGHRYDVTPGKEYTVLAVTMLAKSAHLGTGVTLDIVDDTDHWRIVPLFLFEVVDPRISRHWVAQKVGDAELALWPESFFIHAYHDRLTDGDEEIVRDFKRVRSLLEAEFEAGG